MTSSLVLASGGGLLDVSLLLTACLGVTAVFVLVQLARIVSYSAIPGSYQRCTCLYPWTVQKQMHLILFLAAICRIGFLVVADVVWSSSEGVVSAGTSWYLREAFYALDLLPVLLYFSAALTVSLFWARIHYESEESPGLWQGLMLYALSRLHWLAYLGLALVLALQATITDDNDDTGVSYYYVTSASAAYVSVLYLLCASLLLAYARLTARGVTLVPIEVHVRKRKQNEIWSTALLLVSALVVRLVVLLSVLSGRALVLSTWRAWTGVFLYFWMLENGPALVLLWYFHRMPSPAARELLMPHEDKLALSRLLGGGSSKQAGEASSSKPPTKVSPEMIEASLQRLATLQARRSQSAGGGAAPQPMGASAV